MRNTSRKIDLNKTSRAGSLNVVLHRKDDEAEVREKKYGDSPRDYFRKVYLYSTLLFSDEDGENRFYAYGHQSRTTVTALNTIAQEMGFNDLKFRVIKSDMWAYVGKIKAIQFRDGLSAREIYGAAIEVGVQ